jgi:hypothetical protein
MQTGMFYYPWLAGQKTEADLSFNTPAVDLRDGEELSESVCRCGVVADSDSRQGPYEGFGSRRGLSEEILARRRRRDR